MQPESGGICEGLTQDLPLGYLQGGDGQGQILGVAFRKSPEHVLGFPLSPVTVQRPGSRHGGPNRCRANAAKKSKQSRILAFYRKPRPDSGLDYLLCTIFARQRHTQSTGKLGLIHPILEPNPPPPTHKTALPRRRRLNRTP